MKCNLFLSSSPEKAASKEPVLAVVENILTLVMLGYHYCTAQWGEGFDSDLKVSNAHF